MTDFRMFEKKEGLGHLDFENLNLFRISIFEFRIFRPFFYHMVLKEEAADNNGKGADPANGGCRKVGDHSAEKAE